MTFTTQSGSTYELDVERKRVRRLSGARAPEPRLGTDGGWRSYKDVSDVRRGACVFITWPEGTPLHAGSPSWAVPSTITSPVVEVQP